MTRTGAHTTLTGRDELQGQYNDCETSLRTTFELLESLLQQSSFASQIDSTCVEISEWLDSARDKLYQCEQKWDTDVDLEAAIAELEVSSCLLLLQQRRDGVVMGALRFFCSPFCICFNSKQACEIASDTPKVECKSRTSQPGRASICIPETN